jgi:hypothetical protein
MRSAFQPVTVSMMLNWLWVRTAAASSSADSDSSGVRHPGSHATDGLAQPIAAASGERASLALPL